MFANRPAEMIVTLKSGATPIRSGFQRALFSSNAAGWRILAAYMLFAVLAVVIVALHSDHFAGRPYRQDEAWIVHGALERYGADAMVQWVSSNIHPPLWMMTANAWVDLFGQHEAITRFLSTLFTLLSLALLHRLAADLTGGGRNGAPSVVALGAVFLLGTSTFFQFYTHEFRPYPALVTCTLGMMWGFMRWLKRPNFTYALLFVGFGVAALYVHFFAVYALAGLAVFTILFVRLSFVRALRTIGLFAAIGGAYLGWLLPFLHAILVTNPGGIDYAVASTGEALLGLYRNLSFRPVEVAQLLLITGVLIPMRWVARPNGATLSAFQNVFRFGLTWRKMYPLIVGVTILAVAFGVNAVIANLTQRSLVILMPLAALVLAFGFASLPHAGRIAVVVLMLPSAFTFVDYAYPGPQAEIAAYMAEHYEAGSPILMNVPYVPRQVALNYVIQNRMNVRVENDLMWQVIDPHQAYIDFLPYIPPHPIWDTRASSLAAFRVFVRDTDAETLWYIERYGGNGFTAALQRILESEYTVDAQREWEGEYTAVLYRRD